MSSPTDRRPEPVERPEVPQHRSAPSSRRGVPRVVWLVAAIAVVALAAVLVVPRLVGGDEAEADGPTSIAVTYQVEGTAPSVAITYASATGTQQASARRLPLETQGEPGVRVEIAPGGRAFIEATNEGEDGEVTCRILIGDQVVAERTASGAGSIASCEATA